MTNRFKIAQEFANKINSKYIERIILFGSVARGEDNDDSDIDILIVSSNWEKIEPLIADEVYRVINENGELISAHIISEERFKTKQDYSFISTVLKEGVLIG